MSIAENKAIAKRFVQLWGKGSFDIIDELAAPSIFVRYPAFPQGIQGSQVFKKVIMGFRSAFPDSALDIEDEIAEGDKVVIRWSFSGTHQGNILGIQPSGKKVKWTGVSIYRIKEGKVVEEIGEEDFLSFLKQIGVIGQFQAK